MNSKIRIEHYCDGFAVIVDDERWMFGQEGDNISELVDVFHKLGFKNVTYEEVY